jgi:ADP-ribose pyrophosphatase
MSAEKPMELAGLEVLGDEKVGEGGYLVLRRLRLKLVGRDGSKTEEGKWDFVERPMGLDAVVLALWTRRGGLRVLLRAGVRVPLHFGRPEKPPRMTFPELVAGIVERGEEREDALQRRSAAEALEEAGLHVRPESVVRLGPALFPTPGMCAEMFHFFAAEVDDPGAAHPPSGDGSPFEEGATLEWVSLDEALARCARGEIRDMKTEIGLRRLREHLAGVK